MDEVIVTEKLTRRFGAHVAVDQLDLTVRRGEVFGFLGPNGAGKTTTVRVLNGVLSASAGQAWVLGFDLAHSDEIRRRTGVLTETPSLYESMSARENLLFYGDLYGVPEDRLARRVDTVLKEFGLGERANDRVGSYSKGMRQRLAIARALLHEPPLVFLDEPTASLDPEAARMVHEVIQQQSRRAGHTIFLCTHNLTEAQLLCHRVGVIDRGVLRAVGTPQELARQLWQELQIEIDLHGEPPAPVQQVLDRIPTVQRWALERGRLVLQVKREEDVPELVAAIAAAGGRIFSVIPREHTLEEIYFEIQRNGRSQGELQGVGGVA